MCVDMGANMADTLACRHKMMCACDNMQFHALISYILCTFFSKFNRK